MGIKFESENYNFHITFAEKSWQPKKVRVSVSGEEEPEMERPEYSMKGEDPELDKAWRKYNRMELDIMRRHAEAGLAELRELVDFTEFDKLNFSRKAGCSCGCSPAFIGNAIVRIEGDWKPVEYIFISVKEAKVELTGTMADFALVNN